jgi:hypothetical protein
MRLITIEEDSRRRRRFRAELGPIMQFVDSKGLAGNSNAIPLVGFIQPGNHGLKSMTLFTDPNIV